MDYAEELDEMEEIEETEETEDLADTETEAEDLTEDDDLQLAAQYRKMKEWFDDRLTEQEISALCKDLQDRTPRDCELVSLLTARGYEGQRIFRVDPDTGEALRDTDGAFDCASVRECGTQVPDEFREDEEGVHIREVKDYTNKYSLIHNIKTQAEDRRSAFGEDVDLTFVVNSGPFSVQDADYISRSCEKMGVDIEWQY